MKKKKKVPPSLGLYQPISIPLDFCSIVFSTIETMSSSVSSFSSFGGRIPFARNMSFHSVSAFGSLKKRFNPLLHRLFLDHDVIFYF